MRIFLDLDDTLNQFMTHALSWLGCVIPSELKSRLSENIPDYYANREQIWDRLDYSFWNSIPKSKHFDEIINFCQGVATVILTALPPHNQSDAVQGKLDWVERHFNRPVVFCIDKWALASKNTILIDDSEINCQRFREHGGQAILVPTDGTEIEFGQGVES